MFFFVFFTIVVIYFNNCFFLFLPLLKKYIYFFNFHRCCILFLPSLFLPLMLFISGSHWLKRYQRNTRPTWCSGKSHLRHSLSQDFKMPVKNDNHEMFACPDLATQLLQILIPITLVKRAAKGLLRRCFVRKGIVYHPKKTKLKINSFSGNDTACPKYKQYVSIGVHW